MNESDANQTTTGTVMDTWCHSNLFLGKVQCQELTVASLSNKLVHSLFLVEGALMFVGNALLIIAIVAHKALRRKEMYMIAGLAMGDLLYGIGYFFAGIRRLSLALQGKHLWKVTPWSCMKAIQTPFFIAGSQAAAFMLVIVSLDRLLAVRWFAFYMGLTARYSKMVILIAFSYSILAVPVVAMLSAYAADTNPTIPALCISTHVGPGWFAPYQPTIQMSCGVLSVLIYVLTWYFYNSHFAQMARSVQNQNIEKQRKITRAVGMRSKKL